MDVVCGVDTKREKGLGSGHGQDMSEPKQVRDILGHSLKGPSAGGPRTPMSSGMDRAHLTTAPQERITRQQACIFSSFDQFHRVQHPAFSRILQASGSSGIQV